jgi:hypothetical protein
MKINIAKALKIKNRIAKKVTELRDIVRAGNSRRSDQPETTSVEKAYSDLLSESQKLWEIKYLISRHSAGISAKLVSLSEFKGEIAWLRQIRTVEKVEKQAFGDTFETYTWTNFLTANQILALINEKQQICDDLQDGIDEYNAMTTFDWPY